MQIVLEPGAMEFGVHRDAYSALVVDLTAQGFDAQIVEPIERRHGVITHAAADLVIYVGAAIGASIIDSIVKAVIERVRHSPLNKQHGTRRGVIFGPDGEVLREFEVSDPGDD